MNQAPTASTKRGKLGSGLIVEAALARVEQLGLEELSARKLARDLGCEAMSLYHHIGSMESLKDAIVERLLGSIAPRHADHAADGLKREAEAYLQLAETYPRSFHLIATRRWQGEQSARTAARAVARFQDLGFGADEALARARTLGAYLNGAGMALAAWATDPAAPAATAGQVKADLNRGLDLLVRSLAEPG